MQQDEYRDMLATFAMQGMLAHARPYTPDISWKTANPGKSWHHCLAKEAYQIADAMMKRKRELKDLLGKI